jgi:hypothetical protein
MKAQNHYYLLDNVPAIQIKLSQLLPIAGSRVNDAILKWFEGETSHQL